jgi:hypothetical protein
MPEKFTQRLAGAMKTFRISWLQAQCWLSCPN